MTTAVDSKKKKILKKIAAATLLVAAACLLAFALYRALDRDGYLLPSWTKPYQRDAALCGPGRAFWEEKTLIGEIKAQLKNKRVKVADPTASIDTCFWTSPDGVLVQDILLGDIDRDGADELILLCWRRGSFGDHMPFWVEKNDNDWGQHIFIYDYLPDNTVYPNKIHPIWMSSAIPMMITGFSFDESKQAIYVTEFDGRVTGWAWLSWGLELISEESSVSFLCAGDLLIHEAIYGRALAEKSFDFLFDPAMGSPLDEELSTRIRRADVATIGQETPLVTDSGEFAGFPSFGTPAFLAEAVAKAGFDVAVCATNHALDRGLSGIERTISSYRETGVLTIGTQTGEGFYDPSDTNASDAMSLRPYEILEQEGIRFALLSFTYGTNGRSLPEEAPYAVHLLPDLSGDLSAFRLSLKEARANADCVIVFVHWGTEYASQPNEMQKAYAQIFLEEGVDVVIGTHPHVVQPYEILTAEAGAAAGSTGAGSTSHQMLVFYSLGNFISANQDPDQNSGALASFSIKKTGDQIEILDPELIPINSIYLP
ncbi:MAG: CapA family protein [Firmicutes bacterium]|nr:CapA family protein [Bacillota bacterium]